MIQPLGPRLFVRPLPDEFREQLASGLFITELSREVPHRGEVVRLGTEKMPWRIGETVIYGEHAGFEFEDEGLLMLAEHEVLCGVVE